MNVDTNASFIKFIYPFTFQPQEYRERSIAIIQSTWDINGKPELVWKHDKFPQDDLLPHVSNFLNAPDHIFPTARIWTLCEKALSSPNGGLGKGGGQSGVLWKLHAQRFSCEFRFSSIQLVMFRYGVGFIILKAEPIIQNADHVEVWQNFLHYFRFTREQRGNKILGTRKIGINLDSNEAILKPYFPLPAGGILEHPDGIGNIDEIISMLLRSGNTQKEENVWWEDVFVPGQLMPFVALFVRNVDKGLTAELIYQIRNFYPAYKDAYPSQEMLRMDSEKMLSYSKDHWFFFSLEGGGFIGINSPQNEFFRFQLTEHLANKYFLLYLLVLQQRYAQIALLKQIAKSWIVDQKEKWKRKESFDYIKELLFDFTARGYFAQAMQGEYHHLCYRRWQDVLQVERLYDEISKEIRYMYEYLTSEAEKRRQEREENLRKTLEFITWIIGFPLGLLTFLEVSATVGIFQSVLATTLGLITGIIIYLLKKKS